MIQVDTLIRIRNSSWSFRLALNKQVTTPLIALDGNSFLIEGKLNPSYRTYLNYSIRTYFNKRELRELCHLLQIDYEELVGEGKQGKVWELISYCERHGMLSELLEQCKKLRPHTNWGLS